MLVWHANGNSGVSMQHGLKTSDTLLFNEPSPDAELSELGEQFWDLSQNLSQATPEPGPSEKTNCQRAA